MEQYQSQTQVYKILMHPTRLAILDVLREDEQCVCHIEAALGMRQAHISQHLMVLREAELVSDRRDGWNVYYRLSQPGIIAVLDAMNAFCGVAYVHGGMAQACPCPKCNPEGGKSCGNEMAQTNDAMEISG